VSTTLSEAGSTRGIERGLRVINLYGAPGVGKSTVRAGVFWLMKNLHQNIEEVSEHAKDLVHSGQTWQLRDAQLSILAAQQHRQLLVARAGYAWAVTDSPLLLCVLYAPPDYMSSFERLALEAHERYDNHNFFLTRAADPTEDEASRAARHCDRGRHQSYGQSQALEQRLRAQLERLAVPYVELPTRMDTPWAVVERVCPGLTLPPRPVA
jgi:hypothetical protein